MHKEPGLWKWSVHEEEMDEQRACGRQMGREREKVGSRSGGRGIDVTVSGKV